ncbi:hypothetical protein GCM10025883_33480 [Mobilicoccus caccae]|uniref:Peptidase M20 dimerisation domain-containing protein n=2 Tax=Mobilicoccus caccae TaxID=1859295 RepID=A0ABQ6ITN2_9MICO|nr:hypothetical protein GCM10025883_33480 [Mobilicoccus caccae]
MIAAHKAMTVMTASFTGVAAHSSLTPSGVNAIEYASRFVVYARNLADSMRDSGPFDEAYDVPHTTMSVNEISGGIAQNTVPDRCDVTVEFRAIAENDPEEIVGHLRECIDDLDTRMREENPDAGATLTVLSAVVGLDTAPDSEGARFVADLVSRTEGLTDTEPVKVTYGTEAGLFSKAGIDTLVLGPGDIAQAHAADEFVELDQIRACERFFSALAARLSE